MSDDADARSALAADLEQIVSRLPGELKAAWSDGSGGIAEARLDGAVAAARDLLAGRVLAGDDA